MRVKRVEFTLDAETGEIMYRSEQDMAFYLFTKNGYLLYNNKLHVRITREFNEIAKTLTKDERGKLYEILPYLDEHNRFMRPERPDKPMGAKHFATALQVSLPRSYAFLKRLEMAGIVRKGEDKTYYVNPQYMMASSRLSPELYSVFRDVLDVPEWVRKRYEEMM